MQTKKNREQTIFFGVTFCFAFLFCLALVMGGVEVKAEQNAIAVKQQETQVAKAKQKYDLTPMLIGLQNDETLRFDVELAQDVETWRQGLMYRTEMPEHQGMLFFFPVERPLGMWMKNTYIPLDMLFINGDGVVVDLHENAVPHSLAHIKSRVPGRAVLEINGGLIAKWGIAVGDQVYHAVFNNMPYEE